jgi:bifunctional DNA-binding transcriptional regulator/antitoxin component of YhaV-PrlF toxin-antitoxin module
MYGVSGDDTDVRWNYLGQETVKQPASNIRRIQLPDRTREALQRSPGDHVNWAYENEIGFLILATDSLEQVEQYTNVGQRVKVGNEKDNYRVTIPKPFFRGVHEDGLQAQGTPPEARVTAEEKRHFLARDDFLDDDHGPRTCYLLTRSQLETRVEGRDDAEWSPRFNSRPQFLK